MMTTVICCLLLHILNFALERQVNIESNKGQSCDFSVKGSVCLILVIFKIFRSKLTKIKQIEKAMVQKLWSFLIDFLKYPLTKQVDG